MLAFDETGAYRLLLSAMARTPRSCSASTRRPSSRSSPTTTSTRPTSSRPSSRSWTPTATWPAPRTAVHPPPHDPLPPGARPGPLGPRRQLQRRPREAVSRPQGDARPRHREPGGPATEPGTGGGRVPRGRLNAQVASGRPVHGPSARRPAMEAWPSGEQTGRGPASGNAPNWPNFPRIPASSVLYHFPVPLGLRRRASGQRQGTR